MKNKMYKSHFITPESYEELKRKEIAGPNGWLLFVACNAGTDFALSVKKQYESMLNEQKSAIKEIPIMGTREEPLTRVFSDSETCPRLPGHVAGSDAYVFQCVQDNTSGFTVNENIQQLLQVIRTLHAHRARTITIVTPYSPYSRQDKPTFMKRESALASLFADQLKVAGANLYLTYHPHTLSLYGFYEPEVKFVALSGLDLFVAMFERFKCNEDVIVVSTDAGGAKFTLHYSEVMDLDYAIANKFRQGKDQSNLLGIIGNLDNKKTAIITDDETVTGSSILNTIESLYKNYGIKKSYAAVSHIKIKKEFIAGFIEAHKKYGLAELHVTDTIPQIPDLFELDFVVQHTLSGMFASTINRLHFNQSVSRVFSRS